MILSAFDNFKHVRVAMNTCVPNLVHSRNCYECSNRIFSNTTMLMIIHSFVQFCHYNAGSATMQPDMCTL